ncbi:MAG: tRNA1(Val) (adenine(37)-N6)-methyltransferase [Thermodesulfobacteriota bacterium]
MDNVQSQRDLFPRGLCQPANGFRFAIDALLLSAFVVPKDHSSILDLGCGCGVIGLGLLLLHPKKNLQVHGIDKQSEMVCCARENISRLNMHDRLTVSRLDIETQTSQMANEEYDLVLTNPPYNISKSGRKPKNSSKLISSFGTGGKEPLDLFVHNAKKSLKNKGRLALIFRSERTQEILVCMDQNGFALKRMRFIHGHKNKKSRLVLMTAIKNATPGDCRTESPLILYKNDTLTPEALQFCPFLACNRKRS